MRKGCSDAIIISAHLNLDKMLDLSDAEMVDKIDQIWLKMCQTKKNFQNSSEKDHFLHELIDVFSERTAHT